MPAETIYTENMDVRVAWGNDLTQTLQLAVKVPRRRDEDDPTRVIFKIFNEWLAAAGEEPISLSELTARMKANGYPAPVFDGYTAQLSDWAAVNTLIKVLKRARDRVFGQPE